MKNIQVIDGATNCSYRIYTCSDEDFLVIFPAPGQDIEFASDLLARLTDEEIENLLDPLWKGEVKGPLVNGVHGTLFYQHSEKRAVYPTKRESERVPAPPRDPSVPRPTSWR